jgi:hypothetical protein
VHVVHVLAHLPHLQFLHLFLEILDVPSSLSYLCIELRLDHIIECLLAHGICRIDERLLALDLLVDGAERLIVVIHGGRMLDAPYWMRRVWWL